MSDEALPDPSDPAQQNRWLLHAARSVQAPGTALQWYGMVSILIAVLFLIVYLVSPDTVFKPLYEWTVKQQEKQPAENRVPIPPYRKWLQQQVLPSVISTVVSLGSSFVIVIGGMKMKQLNGYGWAVAGAILSIIPCTNSCCCIGAPVGMWAMVALFGSDVRTVFSRVGAAGGLEAYLSIPPGEPM
jgi:hypothetical protein